MSESSEPVFRSIFHPTDFSAASRVAFEHALKIALANRSYLDILHVDSDSAAGPDWAGFPHVRETLARWGLLEEGSPKGAVATELGLKVGKVELGSRDPVSAMATFLEGETVDLLVLSTEGREGLPRWIKPSVSERLARRSKTVTLFVPGRARGFVSAGNGQADLSRVLIPVDHRPDPQRAVAAAGALLRPFGAASPRLEALFVGEAGSMPAVVPPAELPCSFERLTRGGAPVEAIVEAAIEGEASLIVMTTAGRHGILDALRGSTTEQVLRRAPCPVLAIPEPA
ncbi:universal stress protein [Pelagibius sp.]|uniref:universal stress protein n=1 Tax=Pelagibius sp. TaxID=1931238 RepID=UPI002623E777|nr:universal stress protein [Pelagibius sp.]